MSPVRRVRIDDRPDESDYEADRLEADDEARSVEEYEADERERLLDCEAEQQWADEESEDADGPLRDRDLGTGGFDGFRTPPRPLTEQERRAAAQASPADAPQFGQAMAAAWPYRPSSPYIDVGEAIVELWHGDNAEHEGEALSLRGGDTGHFKEDRDTQAAGRPAGEWLETNDPELTRAGLTAELANAFEPFGLSLEYVRRGAFPNGRPKAAARELRVKVRSALLPTYEADRKRVLLSEILGCSRQALHNLMSAETKP